MVFEKKFETESWKWLLKKFLLFVNGCTICKTKNHKLFHINNPSKYLLGNANPSKCGCKQRLAEKEK
jgi:hypothetical protein